MMLSLPKHRTMRAATLPRKSAEQNPMAPWTLKLRLCQISGIFHHSVWVRRVEDGLKARLSRFSQWWQLSMPAIWGGFEKQPLRDGLSHTIQDCRSSPAL